MWPTKHLYWTIEGSRRCWGDRRGGRPRLLVAPPKPQQHPRDLPPRPVVPEADPLPPPRPYMPAELMPALPLAPLQFPPAPLFDETWVARWQDEPAAPAAPAEGIVIYSTFSGPPPDVWPERRKLQHNPGVLGMMLAAAFAFVVGYLASTRGAG